MTSLCFLAVIVFGVFSAVKLPIDLMPDIETNTIMIFTYYNGASANDIENNVTRPLENTLNSVEHLKHITSNSRENVSVITMQFEYGYDIDDLTNDVRDKLDMVSNSLPNDANTPIIFKFSTDMIPIVLLSVQAEESQQALYKILDENVANPYSQHQRCTGARNQHLHESRADGSLWAERCTSECRHRCREPQRDERFGRYRFDHLHGACRR